MVFGGYKGVGTGARFRRESLILILTGEYSKLGITRPAPPSRIHQKNSTVNFAHTFNNRDYSINEEGYLIMRLYKQFTGVYPPMREKRPLPQYPDDFLM
jgi:hypothetical protein